MRDAFRYVIQPWSKLIADPVGYPDHPPHDRCWEWTGSTRIPGPRLRRRLHKSKIEEGPIRITSEHYLAYPQVKFLGKVQAPLRVLWAYMHHTDLEAVPSKLTRFCRNPLCVNPAHAEQHAPIPASAPEPAPDLEPPPDPRKGLFKRFFDLEVQTLEDGLRYIPNAEAVNTYFPQYLEFIKDKTEEQIIEAIRLL